MDERTFTAGSVIKEGWGLAKGHWGFLVGYGLILGIITLLMNVSYGEGPLNLLIHLGIWVAVMLATMGLYRVGLLISKGIAPDFSELYRNYPLFFSWIIAYFLFYFAFGVGLLLLIVPGCYILARFGMYPFFILDKNLGPIEGLKQASEASRGVRGTLFFLFFLCWLINLGGLLLLGIGLLFTMPITMLAFAAAYQRMTKSA